MDSITTAHGYRYASIRFVFYSELGMYMLNRRMFQRGKDNNFFWFHEQSNIFFHVKVYLCYIKENSMTVNEAHLIYFSPTHTSKQVAEAIVHGTGIKNRYWYTYLHWKILERLESGNPRTKDNILCLYYRSYYICGVFQKGMTLWHKISPGKAATLSGRIS